MRKLSNTEAELKKSVAYKKTVYIQIENFMEGKLLKLLTGFRKNHSTIQFLVNMVKRNEKHS